MTTTNDIRRHVTEVLEYLQEAELALYTNTVATTPTRVTWDNFDDANGFIQWADHSSVGEYLHWVTTGNYSAILRDGSLLQITYDVRSAQVVGQRLAYVPCPIALDEQLVEEGHPIADIVSLYERASDVALRSPVRFDFDTDAAGPGHSAAHLTINSAECRIACVAPMHVRRFADFVYRHFYPRLWAAHSPFFRQAAHLHLGDPTLSEGDRAEIHLAWDTWMTATGARAQLAAG